MVTLGIAEAWLVGERVVPASIGSNLWYDNKVERFWFNFHDKHWKRDHRHRQPSNMSRIQCWRAGNWVRNNTDVFIVKESINNRCWQRLVARVTPPWIIAAFSKTNNMFQHTRKSRELDQPVTDGGGKNSAGNWLAIGWKRPGLSDKHLKSR